MSASAKSRMVYPSDTDSPGYSRTKGHKTEVVVVVVEVVVVVVVVVLYATNGLHPKFFPRHVTRKQAIYISVTQKSTPNNIGHNTHYAVITCQQKVT